MTTEEIAKGLVALCREEKSKEAIRAYYSPDIVCVEADPSAPPAKGMEAALAAVDGWEQSMEVHSGTVTGPYINGDQFAVHFVYDVTNKMDGKRNTLDEVALYQVRDGKIVEARFLYSTEMMMG